MGSVGEEIRLFAGWLCIRILIFDCPKVLHFGKMGRSFFKLDWGLDGSVCVCLLGTKTAQLLLYVQQRLPPTLRIVDLTSSSFSTHSLIVLRSDLTNISH